MNIDISPCCKANILNAVEKTAEVHRGAYKGRVDPDELDVLKRCLIGKGSKADFQLMKEFGVSITRHIS